MSIGESGGGLPPDILCWDEDDILEDCQRAVETLHDPARHAMQRVALAPCSPFSVSMDLMRNSAEMARSLGVGLHTHLAENVEDIDYSLAQFGMRPGEYIEALGWTGDDVGMRTACSSMPARSTCSPAPAPVWRTVPVPTCGSPAGLRRCAGWRMPA